MADARLEGTSIADSVIDLIGATPLVRMRRIMEVERLPSVLAMKMETSNPGGSVHTEVCRRSITSQILVGSSPR